MNLRISGLLAITGFALAGLLGSAQTLAQNAYTNGGSVIDTATDTVTGTFPVGPNTGGIAGTPDGSTVYLANTDSATIASTVSVIGTATNTVTATIPVGVQPLGVAVTPDGSAVYVANLQSRTVSVIATATNTVTATIPVGGFPFYVAVTPDGTKVYVTGPPAPSGDTVSVIATATNTVTATIPVGVRPFGVAVTPDGSTVYVVNMFFGNVGTVGTVSVISTASNTVTDTIPVGNAPVFVAVTPDGSVVYVTNFGDGTVSVIATATNMVTATIPVGNNPSGVAVTPDGSKAYVLAGGGIAVIATATNKVTATIPAVAGGELFIQPVFALSPSEVATRASGLAYSRVSRTFNGTVTITNISSGTIRGPFQISLTGLTAGVTLVNATGDFSGSPFLTVPAVASLASGQSATVSVQFQNPSFGTINFTPLIYSGNI
jgi:YVTN family beta-propeller protein